MRMGIGMDTDTDSNTETDTGEYGGKVGDKGKILTLRSGWGRFRVGVEQIDMMKAE